LAIHKEDIIFKNIMELFKGDAVMFFGIDKKVVAATRTELSHVQVQKNINDWVLQADDGSYIHFEFQTAYDADDLYRFMVSDAMLCFKEKKPVKTVVVYSADIQDTVTSLDTGAIQYSVDAFYMVRLDGDKVYDELKAKVDTGLPLTKHDLMSVVFLPLMKNSVDKVTRLEQAVALTNSINEHDEQAQIQAMLVMLAEKFIKDPELLQRLKGMVNVGVIAEMIREDALRDVARKLLRRGMSVDAVVEDTGLSEDEVHMLQTELDDE
jgi:predicted transposase YdaD